MIKLPLMLTRAVVAAIAICLLPNPISATEFKGSGSVTYATAAEEIIKLSDTTTLTRFHLKGVIIADNPDMPIHLSAQDCMGSVLATDDDKPIFSSGSCDSTDNDGDIWWLTWSGNGDDSSTWQVTGGAGKYKGMTGSGKSEWIIQMSDGRSVLHWEGSWQMK